MLPKNQSTQSATPRLKNQNSSVAQKACSTVLREKAVKKVCVSSHAGTSKKSPTSEFNQRVGTRQAVASRAACMRIARGHPLVGFRVGRRLTRGPRGEQKSRGFARMKRRCVVLLW